MLERSISSCRARAYRRAQLKNADALGWDLLTVGWCRGRVSHLFTGRAPITDPDQVVTAGKSVAKRSWRKPSAMLVNVARAAEGEPGLWFKSMGLERDWQVAPLVAVRPAEPTAERATV